MEDRLFKAFVQLRIAGLSLELVITISWKEVIWLCEFPGWGGA